MPTNRWIPVAMLTALLAGCASPAPPAGPTLSVFDCGRVALEDVSDFGLTNDETPVRRMFVPCYVVEHPEGRLLWDGGLPLAMAGQGEIEMDGGFHIVYERAFPEQLAAIGLAPEDIDLVAFSHMHFDHVGTANRFAHATLLIQRAEYEAAFERADENPFFDRDLYSALADAPRQLLDGDHDVFGDGTVRILSAPGHTPGHQVLALELRELGPLVLSGDLYHFRKSRELRRTPVFNTDAAETLRSMDKIEAYIAERGATLWIEHDAALADTLELAPAKYR